MKIHYYFRHKQVGFSIQTVFTTLINQIRKFNVTRESYLLSPFANIIAITRNSIYALKCQKDGEINHITGDVHYLLYVLNNKRTIVTVHDIMYYRYLHGVKKYIWKLLYIYPLKKAAHVTFISEYSKKEVLDIIDLPENKVSVIPDPVSPKFYYSEKDFNSACPLILHIGTNKRKNLHNTIRALNGIVCHLRIVGRLKDETINLLNEYNIDYSNVYNLEEQEVIREYQNADVVNFPSLYEGFGMPIIEGQTTGRVVVTSNISPMKDVAGNGAIFVNPFSIESIKEAYLQIISDKDLRSRIIEKGIVNAQNYTVEAIADQYMKIYKNIKLV
jgi:glycosyltransferase involved in cell wall biosynthesis